jgi:hypothetical protein
LSKSNLELTKQKHQKAKNPKKSNHPKTKKHKPPKNKKKPNKKKASNPLKESNPKRLKSPQKENNTTPFKHTYKKKKNRSLQQLHTPQLHKHHSYTTPT